MNAHQRLPPCTVGTDDDVMIFTTRHSVDIAVSSSFKKSLGSLFCKGLLKRTLHSVFLIRFRFCPSRFTLELVSCACQPSRIKSDEMARVTDCPARHQIVSLQTGTEQCTS